MPFGSPPTPDQSGGSSEGQAENDKEKGVSKEQPSEFESIQREFRQIEEKLTSEAFDIPAEDRVKLVHRILEHSLDDGLRLANRFGIDKENLRKGLFRPSFAIKHQSLIEQLSDYLDASKKNDYVFGSNEDLVDKFNELAAQLKNSRESVADNAKSIHFQSNKAKGLKEQIDDHYKRFLRNRAVKENIPIDIRTEGVRKAEETLKKAQEILKEQYYTKDILQEIANKLNADINLDDATGAQKENWLQKYTDDNLAREIAYSPRIEKAKLDTLLEGMAESVDDFSTDTVFEKLDKHRAKPIKQVYETRKNDAVRTLKKELKQNLIRRGFNEDKISISKNEDGDEFIVNIEGQEINETKKRDLSFEFDLEAFTKQSVEISEWLKRGWDVTTVGNPQLGCRLRESDFRPDKTRYKFMDGKLTDEYERIKTVLARDDEKFVLAGDGPNGEEMKVIDEDDNTLLEFETFHKYHLAKGRLFEKEDQVVASGRRNQDEDYILQNVEGEILDRGEYIKLFKTENGCAYLKQNEEGDKIVYPDGSESKTFEKITRTKVKDGKLYFAAGKTEKYTDRVGEHERVSDVKIYCPDGATFGPYESISDLGVIETEYGNIIRVEIDEFEKNVLISPSGDEVVVENYTQDDRITMTERGLAYIGSVTDEAVVTRESNIFYPDGRKVNMGGSTLEIAEIDGEVVVATSHGSLEESKEFLLYEDGDESERYYYIYDLQEYNNEPLFKAKKESGGELRDYVVHEGVSEIGPFADIPELQIIKNKYYFVGQRSSEGTSAVYNMLGEKVTPEFEKIIDFKVHEEEILLTGVKNGDYEVYSKELNSNEGISLTPREEKKLKLLNMLADEKLEDIEFYLQDKIRGKDKNWKEKAKDFLFQSQTAADTISEAKQENPVAFLETASAKPDNLSWDRVKEIAHEMFPYIKRKRERNDFSGGSVSPDAESYLQNQRVNEFRDGDPKIEGEMVLEMREQVDDMIVSNVLGSYDQNSKRWSEVQFPVRPELKEPVKEHTFTIPDTGYLSELRLPKVVGAEIIKDRIKGITEDGEEITLETKESPLGSVTAEVPNEVEKIVYSQRTSELPMPMQEMSDEELAEFLRDFEKSIGGDLTKPLPGIPEELKLFVRNDLEGLSPKEKIAAIEQTVRDIGIYDFDNKEVMDSKHGASIADKIRIMRKRADDLKDRGKAAEGTGQYAGVCADFALLTAGLLREAGFPAGVIKGFRPDGKEVSTAEAHGTAFVVWPHEKGSYKVIPIDGTPGAGSGGETVDFQEASLEEREIEYEEKSEEIVEESKERIEEVEEIVDSHDPEKIKALSNGELEEILNMLLEHGVKENHVETIKTVLNASRYSPASIEKMDLDDSENREVFRSFVQNEIEKTREGAESTKPAGSELMNVLQEFVRRYERDYSTEETFDMLDEAIEVMADELEEIEEKAVLTTLRYLRAERIQG